MCCAINNKAHLWNGLIKNQYGGQKAKLDGNCDIVDIIGPDVLTLTVGSDIARGPNAPRPACRGYLHKRTQSGLIKGWRKRWFVLTHDCCLYYYRHKRVSMIQVIKIKQSTKKFLCTLALLHGHYRMKAKGRHFQQQRWKGLRWDQTLHLENHLCLSVILSLVFEFTSSAPLPTRK